MVQPLVPKESLGNIRTGRWRRCPEQSWLRRAGPLPHRRQPTSRAAPYGYLPLASGVPLVMGWGHSVSSGAYHGASLWFTTLCALSVALGALSYNLMAVLAEFFHFDRRAQQVQSRTYLHGVDVTHSRFLQLPAVLAAVEFAAEAHRHQRRKTGEPYVTHCIETALIVEACLPPPHSAAERERHVYCIMAAVLHDVIDDTPTDLSAMQQSFGPRVAALVHQVSKLSQMNQLLRRGKRQGWAQYSPNHFKQLRKLIVDLAFEEPLVILVKLADRLHNMRTVFVLPPDKQRSVAEETLEVWCSMAESLGWDGLKSEMEDLCFAVLQPSTYCTLRAELDRLWSLPTLAVVEEQLEGEQGPGGPGTEAGGPGDGGSNRDGLGLRIVQVSGPETPVRHYTRAAGVREAAAAAAGGGGYGSRRQRGRRLGADVGGRAEAPGAEEGARERAQALAAEAAVAAAAVPLPPPPPPAKLQPWRSALAAEVEAVMPAPAVAAVPSPVEALEADSAPRGTAAMRDDGGGDIAAAVGALESAAVAVTVTVEEEPEASTSGSGGTSSHVLGGGFGVGDGNGSGGRVDGGASSHNAERSPPLASAGAVGARGTTIQSSYTMSPGLDESKSVFRLGDSGAAAGPCGPGTGTVAAAGAAEAFPGLALYGTLESLDGPLLLDGLVLPFGMTAVTAEAPASGGRGSTDGGSDGGEQAVSMSAPDAAAAAAPEMSLPPSPGRPVQVAAPAQEESQRLQAMAAPPEVAATAAAVAAAAVVAAAAATAPGSAAAAVHPLSDQAPAPPLPLSPLSPQQERLKLILSTVVPFESVSFKNLRGLAGGTCRGLDVLDECAALLYNEIQIRSQAGGLGINIQGRLKSLHSVYKKMVRKNVAVAQVYDSRALRVIVDDGEGASLREAVDVCYRLVSAVHSIWKPIKREFDDYIANPKPSGYQALHTAVRGPGGIPMEVQIKTSSMHELAEYGAAAHWVYKEYTPVLAASPDRGRAGSGGAGAGRERLPAGYVGQPLLKVSKDKLRYGVVVSRSGDGRRLTAAVKLGPTFRPFPTRVPDWGFYSGLVAYTRSKGWQVPGHGDLVLRLEEFVQCDDGRYHRRDHLGYLIPAETITLLEGFEEDAAAEREAADRQGAAAAAAAAATASGQAGGSASDAAAAAAAAADGAGGVGDALRSSLNEAEALAAGSESCSAEQRRFREHMRVTFAKTQQLRSMIAWGEGAIGKYVAAADYPSDEVSVLIWPGGRIEHFARGTTAGDIVAEKGLISTGEGEGLDGYKLELLINVNNRLVPEDTLLNDGDLVILAREKVRI